MPSNRPVIALRLTQPLYEKVRACAREQGRSLSSFIEIIVKKEMEGKPRR